MDSTEFQRFVKLFFRYQGCCECHCLPLRPDNDSYKFPRVNNVALKIFRDGYNYPGYIQERSETSCRSFSISPLSISYSRTLRCRNRVVSFAFALRPLGVSLYA